MEALCTAAFRFALRNGGRTDGAEAVSSGSLASVLSHTAPLVRGRYITCSSHQRLRPQNHRRVRGCCKVPLSRLFVLRDHGHQRSGRRDLQEKCNPVSRCNYAGDHEERNGTLGHGCVCGCGQRQCRDVELEESRRRESCRCSGLHARGGSRAGEVKRS